MSTNYSMPSDEAYRTVLNVLPAGQRWFAFDVPMGEARKGEAARFGMTLWNFHSTEGADDFESWGITRDTVSGAFWYRVVKARDGVTTKNRKSLWDALQIAVSMPQPFPMKGILKDRKTRRCAPAFVFDIADVQMQTDGSCLWLKLNVLGDDVGTGTNISELLPMIAVRKTEPTIAARRRTLPDAHYVAIRDAAVRVYLEEGVRSEELDALHDDHGIDKGTASAIFNNFRCLTEGLGFKSPMRAYGLQLFIDAIIAKRGDPAVPKVIEAAEAHVSYAEKQLKQSAPGFRDILNALKNESAKVKLLQKMVQAAESVPDSDLSDSKDLALTPQGSAVPSEILREVWVRGPQHAAFRRDLLRRWSGKCSVHGAHCNDQLRASHIVPWSLDESTRGDVNNGLLLSVPLDSLFDRGLISFDDAGVLILSTKLQADTAEHFGVRPGLRIAWEQLSSRERYAVRVNLARHRELHQL